MKWILGATAACAMLPVSARIDARPMIHDPVALNIGINCQWQPYCMGQQRAAMMRSLSYVATRPAPQWRLQLCNRNAGRSRTRVDWVGFDHCIRNSALRPPSHRRRER
jgi:hypothetical protein